MSNQLANTNKDKRNKQTTMLMKKTELARWAAAGYSSNWGKNEKKSSNKT